MKYTKHILQEVFNDLQDYLEEDMLTISEDTNLQQQLLEQALHEVIGALAATIGGSLLLHHLGAKYGQKKGIKKAKEDLQRLQQFKNKQNTFNQT